LTGIAAQAARDERAEDCPKPRREGVGTIFLLPFLAMEVAAIFGAAVGGGFEWLYPLRIIAPAVFLWIYRADYAETLREGGPSRLALLSGIAVFALWVALALNQPSSTALWVHIGRLGPAWGSLWIGFRVIGPILTTPLAEELAFRGFLLRRIASPVFEDVDPAKAGWLAVAVSSIVFGLFHGSHFLPGLLAGLIYAFTYTRSRKLGEAVFAHALANASLIVLVFATGDWKYW
jgi:CAAX prenyl protease-like protein